MQTTIEDDKIVMRVSKREAIHFMGAMVGDAVGVAKDETIAHAQHRWSKIKDRTKSIKDGASKTRPAGWLKRRVEKINHFVQRPIVVKAATAALAIDSVFGLFSTIAISGALFAAGSTGFGCMVIFGYVMNLSIRYILGKNALSHA